MPTSKNLHLVGFASGLGAEDPGAAEGPLVLQQSTYLKDVIKKGLQMQWQAMLSPNKNSHASKLEIISEQCSQLANEVYALAKANKFFTVIGGDHSCGIGTWSGLSAAYHDQGPIGLIWVDAHMDSHTPHTSMSGNIHGMPVASLLGYGMPSLTKILNDEPKIKPEHLCLIGVRSFERGEAALLKELNVRVYFMEEVRERGLSTVMQEAIAIVKKDTVGFGVSIDVDSITPEDAPGTGAPVANGISAKDLCLVLQALSKNPLLKGLEIAEFDPHHDQNRKTEQMIVQFLSTFASGNQDSYAIFKDSCARAANVAF